MLQLSSCTRVLRDSLENIAAVAGAAEHLCLPRRLPSGNHRIGSAAREISRREEMTAAEEREICYSRNVEENRSGNLMKRL